MMKKILAATAALTLLFTAAGCNNEKDSSTAETTAPTASAESTTTAETVASETVETTTIDIEAAMPQELDLNSPAIFQKISFEMPGDWGNMSVGDLGVWYPTDGSGALTVQIFDPAAMDMEGETQKETLENLGKNLAEGQTIVSEVWNTVQDADAYAITYSPAAEDDVDVAQKMNLSILFYVEDTPYSMTFSNYTGISPVLKMPAILWIPYSSDQNFK